MSEPVCKECGVRPPRSPTTSYCFECFHGFPRLTDGKGLMGKRNINVDFDSNDHAGNVT